MDNKTSKCPSYLLKRQERVSIEGHQRTYIRNTQTKVRELYRRPLDRVSGSTATKKPKSESSSSFEKIEQTRQKVESLNQRIGNELYKLGLFRNHFLEVKDAMSRSASPEKANVKNMTWSQSFKANQAKESPLSINRTPASGGQRKGKLPKCRTLAVAARSDSPSAAERVSGGCCCDCGYGAPNNQTVYQNMYGTCHCHCCHYAGSCDMGYPQQFCACGGLNGEVSPLQGTQFGIPYNMFPRQNCRRLATDLNTEAFCRNWRPEIERSLSPKGRKDKRNPAITGKSTNYKKVECNLKREATSITSPARNKARKPEKPIKIGQKKELESAKDQGQKKSKPNDSSLLYSKGITSRAQPSKFCPEELTDETKAQNYQEYLNLYKQENCKPLQSNPTYTRMAVKKEFKSERDERPVMMTPMDTKAHTDSARVKDCLHYKEITAHYQLADVGSSNSTPDSVSYQCCEEKVSYANEDGCLEDWGYTIPENSHLRGDPRAAKPHVERNFQRTGEATNANRSLAQQSKSPRSKDDHCEAIRQERREHCEKLVEQDEKRDRQMRTHPVQRSVSPQSGAMPTSYVSIALQYPSDACTGQVQREAKNTQTEFPCRESPTQTERQIRMNKACQVYRERQHFREQVNPASPTPSQCQNSSLMSMVSRLDYDYVHNELPSRQGTPRTPRKMQQSHDDYHIQTPSYSPRTPPPSYRQPKSSRNECDTVQIAQAGANSRSNSPHMNNSIETLSLSYSSQCSQCQENYKNQYTQNMSGNIDCLRSDDESSQLDCPSCTDHISQRSVEARPECVRYEGEVVKHPGTIYDQHSPRSCMSSPGQAPVLETVCEKRTRTVTFEDEKGDLTKEEHVQESCRSLIDWERALKYHTAEHGDEGDYMEQNSTCI
ncbi:uncharacterized protein LOC122618457 isoform X2 [Drosophila teissieri]|uniref:uncharacterized protein LOC122618457 isoform X2 n=1 Tax=Drosophila teissieri TaxID=7243 RepID=UPI001CBA38FA|nr:uncharacterized protein LOC122618457 isoform X2 [Drosophila teissieri]